MLRSRGLGRLMNPRRIPLTLGTAVGVAFAALIGLAPAARADGPDPFEDLFGDTGINAWTPAADASLLSSDPTEAANLDASVENFLADAPISTQFPEGDDPFSFYTWEVLDPSAFTGEPLVDHLDLGTVVPGGLPDNAIGDLAVGLDYSLFASGLAPSLDTGIADSLNFLSSLPGDALALLFFPEDLILIPILAIA
jgi:hypothetical protein